MYLWALTCMCDSFCLAHWSTMIMTCLLKHQGNVLTTGRLNRSISNINSGKRLWSSVVYSLLTNIVPCKRVTAQCSPE